MIGKAMIEIPPKFKDLEPIHPGIKDRSFYRNSEGLAEDVKYYGEWMREKAWERIGHLYPKVDLPKEQGGGTATVIAWIWARTVPSPDPAFSDVQVPITSSFLLSSRSGKEAWIEPVVDRKTKTISYNVRHGGTKAELATAKSGTKAGRGSNFRCLMSDTAITAKHITSAGKAGKLGQVLIAIVGEGKGGRLYFSPSKTHEDIARCAVPDWKPEQLQPKNPRWFSPPAYGMETFGDLFTDRQLVALNTFTDLVHLAREQIENDAIEYHGSDPTPIRDGGTGGKAYAEAVSVYLAFAISKLTNLGSTVTSWMSDRGALRETFARQAIPMVWDYAEVNFFSNSGGNWLTPIEKISKSVADFPARGFGSVNQINAGEVQYEFGTVISSDPPYYDNIGYADLSDFFYCWLKQSLKPTFPDLFGVLATPKTEELVATPYRHGGNDAAERFFLEGMTAAIARMAERSSTAIPATIYYAFKQSEVDQEGVSSTGWATFLQAVISAGFSVLGTWPIRTESPGRLIAKGTNALANSVVLVCRKKDATAESVTRAEFIRTLKRELPPAIAELQAANVSPADMPQSAIGPGMGVFSRYAAVLEADDSPMTVKTALQLINTQLDEYLNDLHGEFDAETRFTATWFQQHGFDKGEYGTANSIATARGISVESVKHAGIVESSAGSVRIFKRDEIDPEWDPETDDHFTIWEACQHLIRTLENDGEYAAAELLKKIGSERAETVKDLAYYLYDVCGNKRQDAKEATSYNGLIAVWTDLTRLAATIHVTDKNRQTRMDI